MEPTALPSFNSQISSPNTHTHTYVFVYQKFVSLVYSLYESLASEAPFYNELNH